jgi:hypothetical protein
MSIRWDEFPHDQLRLRIYKRQAQNAAARSAQSSLVHILRRKLPARNSEDHRRFVELQAARLIEHLRCTRDIYQDFVNERRCDPVLEAHWVVLRCAVLPTAIELLRQEVIGYTNLTEVPARDLSLLFGIPSHVCYKDTSKGFGVVYPPNIDDTTVANDTELECLGKLVKGDTLLHFEDIKDGGAVFQLFGGGPFAVDDERSIHSSWSLCGLQQQFTLVQWVQERERLWRICSPWSEGRFPPSYSTSHDWRNIPVALRIPGRVLSVTLVSPLIMTRPGLELRETSPPHAEARFQFLRGDGKN